MARNFAAEARVKFPAPNPPAPDNYSPGGYTRAMGEYEMARDAVLAKRERWVSRQEAEERERELEEEREREREMEAEREREREKKEAEERRASACQVARSSVRALAADPKTCIRCARLGKLLVIFVVFPWVGIG